MIQGPSKDFSRIMILNYLKKLYGKDIQYNHHEYAIYSAII